MDRSTFKHFTLLLPALAFFTITFAAPKVKSTINYGLWCVAATWDGNRVPATSDTIVIPADQVLIVDNPNTLGDVYIQVFGTLRFMHGKLTLGENSVVTVYPTGRIEGNSNSEKIRLGANEVFNGSDADVTGPSMANSTTGSGFAPFTLPVTFLHFTLTRSASTVLLEWSTTGELQAARFEPEVSLDGRQWATVASVQAKGAHTGITYYTYAANKPSSPLAYYRIKEIDQDGRFMYSGVRVLKQDGAIAPAVRIGTMSGTIVIQFSKPAEEKVLVRIFNLTGQTISRHYLYNAAGQVSLDLPSKVAGAVIVSVEYAGGRTSSQVVL